MISATDILNAKILVVDDKEPNVRLIEGMLRIAGYTGVHSTMNPQEVCGLYRANRYDLVLLDLQMPGMDGFEVMQGLKQIEGDGYLPVLVITAQPDHKLRALRRAPGISSASRLNYLNCGRGSGTYSKCGFSAKHWRPQCGNWKQHARRFV